MNLQVKLKTLFVIKSIVKYVIILIVGILIGIWFQASSDIVGVNSTEVSYPSEIDRIQKDDKHTPEVNIIHFL